MPEIDEFGIASGIDRQGYPTKFSMYKTNFDLYMDVNSMDKSSANAIKRPVFVGINLLNFFTQNTRRAICMYNNTTPYTKLSDAGNDYFIVEKNGVINGKASRVKRRKRVGDNLIITYVFEAYNDKFASELDFYDIPINDIVTSTNVGTIQLVEMAEAHISSSRNIITEDNTTNKGTKYDRRTLDIDLYKNNDPTGTGKIEDMSTYVVAAGKARNGSVTNLATALDYTFEKDANIDISTTDYDIIAKMKSNRLINEYGDILLSRAYFAKYPTIEPNDYRDAFSDWIRKFIAVRDNITFSLTKGKYVTTPTTTNIKASLIPFWGYTIKDFDEIESDVAFTKTHFGVTSKQADNPVCLIYLLNCANILGVNYQEKAIETSMHELGHAWAFRSMSSLDADDNTSHTAYCNGKDKNYCLFRGTSNVAGEDIPAFEKGKINQMKYCEGHTQILLNRLTIEK